MTNNLNVVNKLSEIVNARTAYYELETQLEKLMGLPEMALSDIRFDVFIDAEFGDRKVLSEVDVDKIVNFLIENSEVNVE